MDRLYEKGYISNPKGKAKSVALTEEGAKLSAQLFKEYFEVSTS
jgi:predicted transcriptional regulator